MNISGEEQKRISSRARIVLAMTSYLGPRQQRNLGVYVTPGQRNVPQILAILIHTIPFSWVHGRTHIVTMAPSVRN